MLYYDNQSCPLRHLLQLKGSVFPKALRYAIPSLLLSIGVVVLMKTMEIELQLEGGGQIWTGYNLALSFLLVFRTQQAYARWWEGGTLLQQIRGEWYNATSSLFAFTSADEAKKLQVQQFQQLMVRLMSMLYCSALQEVSMVQDEKFEILDTTGLDQKSLKYIRNSTDRCAVILQWIQRSVVTGMGSGVVPAPPPVVSRVFQELGRGMVNLHNVKKIKEFPFPFPYAQMITFMLLIHWIITPLGNLLLVDNKAWAITLSFISVLFFWSINYIAIEIEIPFGDAVNHLPIKEMQAEMNRSLRVLLDKRSQTPPAFELNAMRNSPGNIRGVTKFRATMQLREALAGLQEGDDEDEEEKDKEEDEEEEEMEEEYESGSAASSDRNAESTKVTRLVGALSGVSSKRTVRISESTSSRKSSRPSALKTTSVTFSQHKSASADSVISPWPSSSDGGSGGGGAAGRKSALRAPKRQQQPQDGEAQAEVAAGQQHAAAGREPSPRPPGAGPLERVDISGEAPNSDAGTHEI
mmetsp:Transcript_27475/g.78959  ORF Transcript_27475/g.78959 Transcript_27475/m.78959 type:complete len:523 (-) Transcript_27475:327-1895(-)